MGYQLGPTVLRHVLARLGRVGGVDARGDAARHDGARVGDEPLGLQSSESIRLGITIVRMEWMRRRQDISE